MLFSPGMGIGHYLFILFYMRLFDTDILVIKICVKLPEEGYFHCMSFI